MKVFKTLSAGILASALLLGTTACIPEDTSTAVENTVQDETQAKSAVAKTVNGFFGYITDKDNANIMEDLAGMDERTMEYDQIAETATSKMPAGFEYFTTSNATETVNAYAFMSTLAYRTFKSDDFSLFVAADAVSIDGDTATVDGSRIDTVYNGVRRDNLLDHTTAEDNMIHLVKVDGQWLIQAPTVDFNAK